MTPRTVPRIHLSTRLGHSRGRLSVTTTRSRTGQIGIGTREQRTPLPCAHEPTSSTAKQAWGPSVRGLFSLHEHELRSSGCSVSCAKESYTKGEVLMSGKTRRRRRVRVRRQSSRGGAEYETDAPSGRKAESELTASVLGHCLTSYSFTAGTNVFSTYLLWQGMP